MLNSLQNLQDLSGNCSIKVKKIVDGGMYLCEIGTAHGKRTTTLQMKKTLLIAAAALAASIISSEAQVYSQNIVGYVNIPTKPGYTSMANPLGNGNNSATNFFDTVSGNSDGNIILTWTGTRYAQVQIDSGSSTGFSDPNTSAVKPAPILAPGTGYLFNNTTASNTVTYVGTVVVGGSGASTNVVGTVTNVLSSGTTYILPSSILPIGGGITSVLQLQNPAGALDGCLVLIPNINAAGAIHGYVTVQFDSGSGTGFSDPNTSAPKPEPVIGVGQSFLFSNTTGSPILWIQSL